MPIFAIILDLHYVQLTGDEGVPTQSLERVSKGRLNQSYHRMNILLFRTREIFSKHYRGERTQDMCLTMGSLFAFGEGTGCVTELPRKVFKSFYNPLRSVSTLETTQSIFFFSFRIVYILLASKSCIIICFKNQ